MWKETHLPNPPIALKIFLETVSMVSTKLLFILKPFDQLVLWIPVQKNWYSGCPGGGGTNIYVRLYALYKGHTPQGHVNVKLKPCTCIYVHWYGRISKSI